MHKERRVRHGGHFGSPATRSRYTQAVGALQPFHLILILLVVLIIFGAGRLTEVGGAIGKGVRDFRANVEGEKSDPSPAAAARFCSSCGRPNLAGGRYCQQCGAPLPV